MFSGKAEKGKRVRQRIRILLITVLLLAGCGNETPEQTAALEVTETEADLGFSDAAVPQEPLVFRCALAVPFEHPEAQSLFRMHEAAEKATGGRIRIDISTDGALAETDDAALEKVRDGQIEMALVSSAALSAIAPDFAVFSVPFQISSLEQIQRILASDDPVLETLYAEAETEGVSVLSAFATLPSGFFLRKAVPADLSAWQDLLLAVRDSASFYPLAAAGARILELPESAVYPALLTGELDGGEGDLYVWLNDAYNTVAPCFFDCGFRCLPDILIVNSGAMEKITDTEKLLLRQLAEEAAASCYAETLSLSETLANQAAESGSVIEVVEATAFRELCEENLRTMRESSRTADALVALIESR